MLFDHVHFDFYTSISFFEQNHVWTIEKVKSEVRVESLYNESSKNNLIFILHIFLNHKTLLFAQNLNYF